MSRVIRSCYRRGKTFLFYLLAVKSRLWSEKRR